MWNISGTISGTEVLTSSCFLVENTSVQVEKHICIGDKYSCSTEDYPKIEDLPIEHGDFQHPCFLPGG